MKSPADYFARVNLYKAAYIPPPHAPLGSLPNNHPPLRAFSADLLADARVSFLRQSIGTCDAFLADIEARAKTAP
jgi:hypothetical protein